jgi:hypothetical protein
MKPDVNGVYRLGNPMVLVIFNLKVLQLLKLMQLQIKPIFKLWI